MSQFSFCSLVWMFHDRNLNNKINIIHKRALRIAYNDIFFVVLKLITNGQLGNRSSEESEVARDRDLQNN